MSIQSVKTTINGTEYTLTLDENTGKYSAEITAPSASSYPETGHYFPVSVTAIDSYGNSTTKDSTDATLGESLRLFVKEQVKPVISVSAPTSGAYITSSSTTLTFTIKDDTNQATGYSGIDQSTIAVTVSSGTVGTMTKTAITGGYEVSVPITSMSDGSVTITVNGSDFDGNAANTASITFTVDTVAPSLVVTSPVNNSDTNLAAWTVAGTTSDATSNPITVTVKLDGVDQGPVTIGQGGAFTLSGSYTAEGTHTFIIRATDAAGKYSEDTKVVRYSTTAPVIQSVVISPNPATAGHTYTITVEVV